MAGASTNPEAAALRARAAECRRIAIRLDNAHLHRCVTLAGADTWMGPTPTLVHTDLAALSRRLRGTAEALRASARSLERRAAEVAAAPVGVR